MSTSKKLLIRLSSAGDVLLTSSLLKLIRRSEPESEIHFIIKEQFADLIRYNPNISSIHLVQDNSDFHALDRLRKQLLEEKFDVVLDLHNNFRSVYLRRGMAKEIRVIDKEILKRALLVKVKVNLFSEVRPAALKYAQVYDKEITDVPPPEIFLGDETQKRIDDLGRNLTAERRELIFICPGAKHFTKRWPADYWVKLAQKLSGKCGLVLIGGDGDVEVCEKIEGRTGSANFCGKLSLLESAGMLGFAGVVVTNDSFLMHAANALGKKIVAIFGSSVREFGFSPYKVEHRIMEVNGLRCRPCSHIGRESCPKGHFKCMVETKPEAVYRATMELLGRPAP